MKIIIEIETEKYDISVTDKATGTVWTLEPELEMDGTVITPDNNGDRWIR
jgi:hypothetical protein